LSLLSPAVRKKEEGAEEIHFGDFLFERKGFERLIGDRKQEGNCDKGNCSNGQVNIEAAPLAHYLRELGFLWGWGSLPPTPGDVFGKCAAREGTSD